MCLKLTYHVPLLMNHHTQVLEDVINVRDIRLNRKQKDIWFM